MRAKADRCGRGNGPRRRGIRLRSCRRDRARVPLLASGADGCWLQILRRPHDLRRRRRAARRYGFRQSCFDDVRYRLRFPRRFRRKYGHRRLTMLSQCFRRARGHRLNEFELRRTRRGRGNGGRFGLFNNRLSQTPSRHVRRNQQRPWAPLQAGDAPQIRTARPLHTVAPWLCSSSTYSMRLWYGSARICASDHL